MFIYEKANINQMCFTIEHVFVRLYFDIAFNCIAISNDLIMTFLISIEQEIKRACALHVESSAPYILFIQGHE